MPSWIPRISGIPSAAAFPVRASTIIMLTISPPSETYIRPPVGRDHRGVVFYPYGCGNLVALSAPRWGQREGRDYTLKKQWGGIQRIIRAVLVGWIEGRRQDGPMGRKDDRRNCSSDG